MSFATFPSRRMMKSSQKFDTKKQQHIYNYLQFEIMGLEKERLMKKSDKKKLMGSSQRLSRSKNIASTKVRMFTTGSTEQSMTTSLNTMSETRQPESKGQVSEMGKIFAISGIGSEQTIKQEEQIAPDKQKIEQNLESLNQPKEKQLVESIQQKPETKVKKEKITDEQIKQIKVDVQNVPKKIFDAKQFQEVLQKIKQLHANKKIQLLKVNQKHSDQIIQAKNSQKIQQKTAQQQKQPKLITKEQQQEFIKKILQKQPVQIHQQSINPQQTSFLVQQFKHNQPQFQPAQIYSRPIRSSETFQNPVIQQNIRLQYLNKPVSLHQYTTHPTHSTLSSYIYQYQGRR